MADDLRHWLLMFRPETYELVKTHLTIGVLAKDCERFSKLRLGDRVIVYVSRARILDAYGRVASGPFTASDPIFGDKSGRYVHRARIQLDLTGLARDGKKLLYGVSVFEKGLTTTPANALLCSGGFVEITAADYDWLVGCMEGRIQPEWEHAPAE